MEDQKYKLTQKQIDDDKEHFYNINFRYGWNYSIEQRIREDVEKDKDIHISIEGYRTLIGEEYRFTDYSGETEIDYDYLHVVDVKVGNKIYSFIDETILGVLGDLPKHPNIIKWGKVGKTPKYMYKLYINNNEE